MTTFLDSLTVALVGMFVVFAALVLLIFCIKLYSSIVRGIGTKKNNHVKKSTNEKVDTKPSPAVKNTSVSDDIDPELIAVITAAVMASMKDSRSDLMVKSIKRIGHTTPIWNVAGRNEYILSKL